VRTSTPPSRARIGRVWPGRVKSCGVADGSASVRIERAWTHRREDRRAAVLRRDACRHAVARFDRHRERGAEPRLVLRHLQLQAELVTQLAAHRQADPAAALLDHQVDQLGRGELRGEAQVALVLAVGVVDQDDRASGLQILEDLGNRRKGHRRAVRGRSLAGQRAACASCDAGQQPDSSLRLLRE
jgi:hypothetical protein